jgi:hypothetical protein
MMKKLNEPFMVPSGRRREPSDRVMGSIIGLKEFVGEARRLRQEGWGISGRSQLARIVQA